MFKKLLHSKTSIFIRNTKNYFVLLVSSGYVLMIPYFNTFKIRQPKFYSLGK